MRPPHGTRLPAKKRFGQHFLEPAWATKVVRAIAPQKQDVFLEVGPGRAALTRPLATEVRHLLAVEIDRDLASQLMDLALPRVTVVTSDILEVSKERIQEALRNAGEDPGAAIRVAGNLPYNVASPILFRLQELFLSGLPIVDATVMLQREVAERLTSGPGSRDYGALSVLIGIAARVERRLELPPGAFRPPPKVRSTVVHVRFHAPNPRPASLPRFSGLVRDVFTRRRKTLSNALLAHGALRPDSVRALLEVARIDGQRRPETLDVEEFVRLADAAFGLS